MSYYVEREDMSPAKREALPGMKREPSGFKGFFLELRKKRINSIRRN